MVATARENASNLYMVGIRDGRPEEAVAACTGSRYRQHSTGVRDGKEGFVEFFKPFIERNPKRDIQIVRSLQDGDKVFVQAFQSLNDGEAKWVTMDFFDSDGAGKIIEHWDVIAGYSDTNPSGRSSVDGPTEIVDLDQTAANRAIVNDFLQTVLIGRDVEKMSDFINPDQYQQHNADVGDGLESFKTLYAAEDCPLSYQENFLTVAEGNFVATLNRAQWNGQDLCQADLFRVEDGKIVEHWDNSEPCPPAAELVNSGKF